VTVLHSVFGLLLHSNLAVPGLPIVTAPYVAPDIEPDVELFFGVDPGASGKIPAGPEGLVYVSSYTGDDGQPALRVWKIAGGDFLRMEYYDGARFWLDRRGTRVWATWNEPLQIEDAATYLLGPVLGLLLRLRGVICLHASAVALEARVAGDKCAVIFVGCVGSGKSTTAAALGRRNHPIISDDIVALTESENRFLVMPAYPYLSLWQDSAEMLFGRDAALPRFSPHYEKRQLVLDENGLAFAARPLPLGAIFLLAERTAEESAPSLEPVTPRQSMLRLVADSYATNLLDPEMRAREFALLGRLLAVVPVWRLHPHQEPSRIGSLCELVEGHCQGLEWRASRPV
jgi:hypothetical protein